MSIRQALLALVVEEPRYGYQLRAEFEKRTGGTWPLNIGQVYTTLQRLERDALVRAHEPDETGAVVYEATTEGRAAVGQWWSGPVPRQSAARDETTIKLALAVASPGVDVAAVVQTQRRETIQALQRLTRAKRSGTGEVPPLVLDRLIFDTEAEARWLDHVEATLRRPRANGRGPGGRGDGNGGGPGRGGGGVAGDASAPAATGTGAER